MKISKATLQSIKIYGPEPTIRSKQHMYLDMGYDFPEVIRITVKVWLYNSREKKRRRKKWKQKRRNTWIQN